ncbi:MAG: hypothetical protein RML72_00710 [Bacteroidia bacterium]|nr:hypothetical protein [Bacteroidia bacterium]MDW8157387.1 hypothetical protein [Bacteroidia bacterium]
MPQDFDKVFRQNIEVICPVLIKRVIGLEYVTLEEIPDDLQVTLERRPDFLKLVHTSNKPIILQIEIQTEDDPKMVYRLHEYCGILSRKYELEVQQYVVYIGKKRPRMPLSISGRRWYFSFDLIDFYELDYSEFVGCGTPEEVILGILANFGEKAAQEVAWEIITQLRSITCTKAEFEKYVKQLEVLSKLRNLQELIVTTLEAMALQYDLETDIRYQQGIEKGRAEGKIEGKIEGKMEGKVEDAINAIQLGLSDELIARITNLPIEQIQVLRKESNNLKL